MSEKDGDLLGELNLMDDDELAEEVPGDEVDAMADIVDLLDDDDAPESDGLKVVTGDSETAESPLVAEIQPEAVVESPPDEKPKKKRNKPRKKAETEETEVVVPSAQDNKATDNLYENITASVGAVVLDVSVLRIRASKVVIEAAKIEFSS